MAATRWGIAGCGKISHDLVTALRNLPAGEHVVTAVAARKMEAARRFADEHGVATAYDAYDKLGHDPNVDVVYVGTIHPQHLQVARRLLELGKPVLCEKPLTMNLKQTRELVQLARGKNLFLMEAIWSRFFPTYRRLRERLAAGALGDVHQLMVDFGVPIKEVDRIKYKELGGGTILDLGVYTIQLAVMVFGTERPEVVASGHLNEQGVDDCAAAILRYKDGRSAILSCNANVRLPNKAVVCGTKGMAEVSSPFWCPTSVTIAGEPWSFSLPDSPSDRYNFDNSAGLMFEAAEVRRCLMEGLTESPLLTHKESLIIAELEDEMRRQIGVVYPEDL